MFTIKQSQNLSCILSSDTDLLGDLIKTIITQFSEVLRAVVSIDYVFKKWLLNTVESLTTNLSLSLFPF